MKDFKPISNLHRTRGEEFPAAAEVRTNSDFEHGSRAAQQLSGLHLLKHPPYGALISSNALTAFASYMQQVILGWLSISWGHNWMFLAAFGLARIIPKIVLTMPAGIICDRLPRTKVLLACRGLNAVTSLIPLLGLVLPIPMAWLLIGVALGGAIHAFDLPAGRAVLGDVTDPSDLHHVVTLNNGGSHLAALVGPPLGFALGPWGLVLAAALFGAASLMTVAIGVVAPIAKAASERPALRELLEYLTSAPAIGVLVLATLAPSLIDRIVTMMLPSIAGGAAFVSVALLAPEAGALVAALLLSAIHVRLGLPTVLISAFGYGLLLVLAFHFSYEPEILISGLALAGVAKLVFNTTSSVRIQQAVPAELRGRVLAI